MSVNQVNGVQDGVLTLSEPCQPRYDSIQHAGLATALNSTGSAAGYFQGMIDEARVWNYARSQAEIQGAMYIEIAQESGLIGRWGLNEGSGRLVDDSTRPSMGLITFTIETWFNRTGAGVATSTGSGGVTAIPLVTKGRGEADGSNLDMNYFLGIRETDHVLVADFEDTATGGNHPVAGVTPLPAGSGWHHVAVTYDGSTWALYLDGILETSTTIGSYTPRWDSLQHFALATAQTSTGTPAGYFAGVLDEVRLWNYARSQSEIQATINLEITAASGLVGRWGMNENSGSVVNDSLGNFNGTATNGPVWVEGAPFNIPTTPPATPSGLSATPTLGTQIVLTWNDNSDNESRFEVERSTSGSGGPFSLRATLGANVTTYEDSGLEAASQYCYRVRAANSIGASGYTDVACATTPAQPNNAIRFGGTNAYVTFGNPAKLGLSTFTLETWFNRTGVGASTYTGTGGVVAVPLITKGMAEADGSNVDMNYFLGIRASDGVLVADFEDAATGLNHPVAGVTPIPAGSGWHHAAATYNGTTWALYLDGELETTLQVGNYTPRADSIQHAALATALQSNGLPGSSSGYGPGYFDGVIDEARIWNRALTQEEILANIDQPLTSGSGLVARWGLDEGTGTTAGDSVTDPAANGVVQGTNYSWTAGTPFNINRAPTQPTEISPADGDRYVSASPPPQLRVTVSDPEGDPLIVSFYGRQVTGGQTFSIIALPDTQYYTANMNGGSPAIFNAQTQWVVSQRVSRNIVYVSHLGDITEHGDQYPIEWDNADTAMSYLEDPVTTGLPDGIPYGMALGNHDEATRTTVEFDSHFGISRFSGRSYYGGHYGADYQNHYELFSAGGMDFIVVTLEYDPSLDIINWADSVLQSYPARRAILVSHRLIGTGNPAAWQGQGQLIYDTLKDNPNLFLMLCGHVAGEGQRVDTYNGNTVYTLLADYQSRTNGGDGWLRILTFTPDDNRISVQTFSPTLNQFETDADSQFNLVYDMGGQSYQLIGTQTNVPSGSQAQVSWMGLSPSTRYEWYVTISDGNRTTTSPVWHFSTTSPTAIELTEFVAQSNASRLQWLIVSIGIVILGWLCWRKRRPLGS